MWTTFQIGGTKVMGVRNISSGAAAPYSVQMAKRRITATLTHNAMANMATSSTFLLAFTRVSSLLPPLMLQLRLRSSPFCACAIFKTRRCWSSRDASIARRSDLPQMTNPTVIKTHSAMIPPDISLTAIKLSRPEAVRARAPIGATDTVAYATRCPIRVSSQEHTARTSGLSRSSTGSFLWRTAIMLKMKEARDRSGSGGWLLSSQSNSGLPPRASTRVAPLWTTMQ